VCRGTTLAGGEDVDGKAQRPVAVRHPRFVAIAPSPLIVTSIELSRQIRIDIRVDQNV